MNIFLSYILLGLSLAAPIGPVNAAQIDRGIRGGFLHSWLVGVGAVIADGIYMLIVYIGVVRFLETEFMQTLLWLFGFFILIYTGIETIMNAGKIHWQYARTKEPLIKAFLTGFLMSISNPLTILFWLGIYGSVLAKTAAVYKTSQLVLYSGAIFIGLLIWDIAMASVASSFRKYLTSQLLVTISLLSGLSLIGFGCYFGFQAFENLFT
ncbi:LysE family transporter [Neobacillus sp. OS1-32]|jgi:L-lysine exporter family protein LysE/ArgO|uniref:LysE family transporter n=1 Tax=Neobacillus paridis TaxID=2803862 RepID=A0ABS1TSZ1_9BACI|nr:MULTISPECIES: LysE family transporter [Neobacillus]MBL4954432.1 LysE family transporter [Neobacillus paridis]WML30279.1 LysE family transporter [Neobacillus sp. OS1-32]